jgi:hypothetical protein
VHRYGWYVDREAFGTDLHAAGRRALLPRAAGGTICAQSHLELAWAAARQALAEDAAAADLQAADAMVNGSLPLPAELGRLDEAPGGQRDGDIRFLLEGALVPDAPPPHEHARPGFTLRPVAATWDFTVFEATGPARSAYACIPRDSLPAFAAAVEDGALDDAIAAYLALPSRRRVLSASRQTARPGLYDQMGAPAGLLAPERDPQTGRQESGGQGAKQALIRPGKRDRRQQPEQVAPRKASRFRLRAAVIAVAAAVMVAAAGTATALLNRGHSGPDGKPAGVSFQPSALAFPAVQVNASVTRSFTMTNNGESSATITQVSVSGPSRHDFSVLTPALLDAARRGGQGSQAAAQPQPCQRLVPHAQTCTITVAFAPSAPGSRTADLRIYLASSPQPLGVALKGTGTTARPPPSSVAVTAISPASGTAKGGTSVTITGTGFTASAAGTGVSFGGAAAQFTIDSGTQITATSPPGTGTVHITVTTPVGTSAATAADQYRYTQSTATMTTTALSSSANPSVPGQSVTFTATVSPASGRGTPTGTVTFSDGGSQIGTATLDSRGIATIVPASPLALGSHAITASYGGDQNFAASTTSLTQTVSPAATTTAVTSSANPAAPGQAVIYTATVSPVPNGGTVTFSDGSTSICGGARPVGTGTVICQVGSYKTTGTHSITAVYSGDTAYRTSTGSLTETVGLVPTTTTVTSSANPSTPGQTVTYTATVSPVPNGGTVTFSDGGAQICSVQSVGGTGTATCPVGYKLAGTHSITAVYSGDFAYDTSTGLLTQTVS